MMRPCLTRDVDLAIAGAAGGAVFHVPQALIANRYHAQNATWGPYGCIEAMRIIAAKHGMSLSAFDRLRAAINICCGGHKAAVRAYIQIRR